MPEYKELEPPPHLANAVECFWVSSQENSTERLQRVVPDGCADIIYTRGGNKAGLIFAGVMTHFKDVAQATGECSVGVRLRPGMWPEVVCAASRDLIDCAVPLEDLWGRRARELLRSLERAEQWPEYIKLLGQALPAVTSRSSIQQAIEAMERTQDSWRSTRRHPKQEWARGSSGDGVLKQQVCPRRCWRGYSVFERQ